MFAARAHGHRICGKLLVQFKEKLVQSEMFDNGRATVEVQRKHGGAVPPDIPEKNGEQFKKLVRRGQDLGQPVL